MGLALVGFGRMRNEDFHLAPNDLFAQLRRAHYLARFSRSFLYTVDRYERNEGRRGLYTGPYKPISYRLINDSRGPFHLIDLIEKDLLLLSSGSSFPFPPPPFFVYFPLHFSLTTSSIALNEAIRLTSSPTRWSVIISYHAMKPSKCAARFPFDNIFHRERHTRAEA